MPKMQHSRYRPQIGSGLRVFSKMLGEAIWRRNRRRLARSGVPQLATWELVPKVSMTRESSVLVLRLDSTSEQGTRRKYIVSQASASLRRRRFVASVRSRQSFPMRPADSAHNKLRLIFGWCSLASRYAMTGPRFLRSAIVHIPTTRSHAALLGPRLGSDSIGASAVIALPPRLRNLR